MIEFGLYRFYKGPVLNCAAVSTRGQGSENGHARIPVRHRLPDRVVLSGRTGRSACGRAWLGGNCDYWRFSGEPGKRWCRISLAACYGGSGVIALRSVIHIVDDDASFRTAVGRLLRESGYEILVYESAQQLLERLPVDFVSGCILLDVQIPDLSGPELQDHLIKNGSTLPIIFLTGHGDIPTSVKAIKAGAEDFLTKPVARGQLLASIERAIARHETTRQQRDRVNAMRDLVGTLTPRESEVFALVILGKMNKQIAHELGTTERTIKAHRQKVMQKLQVQTLAELVSIGERLGVSASASAPTKGYGKV